MIMDQYLQSAFYSYPHPRPPPALVHFAKREQNPNHQRFGQTSTHRLGGMVQGIDACFWFAKILGMQCTRVVGDGRGQQAIDPTNHGQTAIAGTTGHVWRFFQGKFGNFKSRLRVWRLSSKLGMIPRNSIMILAATSGNEAWLSLGPVRDRRKR